MSYRACIFDLDGTILNTLTDLHNSVNYALALHGLKERTFENTRSFVGNGMRNLIIRSVLEGRESNPATLLALQTTGSEEALIQAVLDDFLAHYAVHKEDTTAPYDGILPLLEELRRRGLKTAVVSNKGDSAVQPLIQHHFPGLFDYIVGEREGIRRKPAPDSVLACLKALSVSADEALYIGDSEVDVRTAAAVPMESVIVTWGFRTPEELRAAGARTFIDRPEELLNFLGH